MTDRTLRPRILATVLSFDSPLATARTLHCLRDQTRRPDGVVIVDNASPVPVVESLRAHGVEIGPGETVRRLDSNVGTGAGHNHGVAAARERGADLVWVLEHDTFAEPTCLERLERRHLSRSADAPPAVVMPRVERNLYEAARRRRDGDVALQPPGGPVAPGIHILTFNGVLVPGAVVDLLGPLREDLFVGFEDRDWTERLERAGGVVVDEPDALVVHARRGGGRYPEPASPARVRYSARAELMLAREAGRPTRPLVARMLAGIARDSLTGRVAVARGRAMGLREGLATRGNDRHV